MRAIRRSALLAALCTLALTLSAADRSVGGDPPTTEGSRSEDGVWRFADERSVSADADRPIGLPQAYVVARIDRARLQTILEQASARAPNARLSALALPLPDSSFVRFEIKAVPGSGGDAVQAFHGRGLDDGDMSARIEWTAKGLHAVISKPGYSVYIDAAPGTIGDYFSYYARDAGRPLLHAPALPLAGVRQIELLMEDKARRSAVQRKIGSKLLDARRVREGAEVAPGVEFDLVPMAVDVGQQLPHGGRNQFDAEVPAGEGELAGGDLAADEFVSVEPRADGRVLVDVRADVTPAVLMRIEELGGHVVNSVVEYRAIRARLPLDAIEALATLDEVQGIRAADPAITNREASAHPLDRSEEDLAGRPKSVTGDALLPIASKKTNVSEGDAAHDAPRARSRYGIDGSGVGIGILSNGVESLADRQASGDVSALVTVLPGQEGLGDEGTAMLEIVHDLAPGAHLYFATGYGGQAQYAANIEALCAAGADVIVDDLFYFTEAAFQDDVVARGINSANERGCFHFSAAGNSGNLNGGTAGVWEGDFAPAESLPEVLGGAEGGVAHDFGDGVGSNRIDAVGLAFLLKWADPLGGSANDYDLYLLDEALTTVVRRSDGVQDGDDDPVEWFGTSIDDVGRRLVVVLPSGEARFLRVNTLRGQLEHATDGQTFGHFAARKIVGVGAVDANSAGGNGGVFDGSESVETFSSDGPRRIFFEPDGSPITSEDFSSAGGEVLQKPDIAAADAVSTATPGFLPFRGTSAAAPHAAAIAALMVQAAGGARRIDFARLRSALAEAAVDIEAEGTDRDSGAGIPLAPAAVSAVKSTVAYRAPTVGTLDDQSINVNADDSELDLSAVFDDPDGDALDYSVLSSRDDIASVELSGSILTIAALAPGTFAVTVRATDPGGLSAVRIITVTVERDYGETDFDADDDGLIEIGTVDQLNAIRYDLDGDAVMDVPGDWTFYFDAFVDAKKDMGCANGCAGYELVSDLDFDDPNSYVSGSVDKGWSRGEGGAGWEPIGGGDDESPDGAFLATFDGNGHTVSNLFIHRPDVDGVGLFGYLNGVVSRVGVVDAEVVGNDFVGALAGIAHNFRVRAGHGISGSFATGRVTGAYRVGGLVGANATRVRDSYAAVGVFGEDHVGGLIGYNGLNWINASYATGVVSGRYSVGGLLGWTSAPIIACYATGRVSGTGAASSGSWCAYQAGGVGGLIGHSCGGVVFSSYATGRVSGDRRVGGLIGTQSASATIRSSYWDVETSGRLVGVGADDRNDNRAIDEGETVAKGLAGKTTAELQAPTGYTDLYAEWHREFEGSRPDVWDFGSAAQNPALKADLSHDDLATWQEFGHQIREGPKLTAVGKQGDVTLGWSRVTTDHWLPAPSISYSVYRDGRILADGIDSASYVDVPPADGTAAYEYQVATRLGVGEPSRSNIVGVGNQVPSPPLVANRSARVRTAFSYTFDPAADPDGDGVSYDAAGLPAWLTFDAASRTLRGTPSAQDAGAAEITITATDDGTPSLSASAAFTLTVHAFNDSNRAPEAAADLRGIVLATGDTEAVSVSGAFRDPDDDALDYSAVSSDTTVAKVRVAGEDVVTVEGEASGDATVTVTASDGALSVTQGFTVTVVNAAPETVGALPEWMLLIPGDPVAVSLAGAFDDADGDELTYGAASSDDTVAAASVSGSIVTLTAKAHGDVTVTATATDVDGSDSTAQQAFSVAVRRDYDADDDGLIEIAELDQLNAVRFDRDGDGVVDRIPGSGADPHPDDVRAYAAAFRGAAESMGCAGLNGCGGYELVADLNFDTNGNGGPDDGDAYWNGGRGWKPIGQPASERWFWLGELFYAVFDGNGHVVSNLFIDRPDEAFVGLFGFVVWVDDLRRGIVRNVELADVRIAGCRIVGGLVGRNRSLVAGSNVSGNVSVVHEGTANNGFICGYYGGGLVGVNERRGVVRASHASASVSAEYFAGGLVGNNGRYANGTGQVLGSFAIGAVTAIGGAGGLVGENNDRVHTSYATGRVLGAFWVGGLVGANHNGTIRYSFSTGRVSGTLVASSPEIGGLVGLDELGEISFSYWDTSTSGLNVGVGSDDNNSNGLIDQDESRTPGISGKATTALQVPTGYAGIYRPWNTDVDDRSGADPWHFGNAAQYPALRGDTDGDRTATWQEFGYQLREGPRLAVTVADGRAELDWTAVDTRHWHPPPDVNYTVFRDGEILQEGIVGSSYSDTSPGVDYQVSAVTQGGEATRGGIVVVASNCEVGTRWKPGQKCRIYPTSTAFEVRDDGRACVGSSCGSRMLALRRIRIAGVFVTVVAVRNIYGTWTIRAISPAPPPNRAPEAVGLLESLRLFPEGDPASMDLRFFFSDPDSDALAFAASSSNVRVASATLSNTVLTVAPLAEGRATVKVTARDPDGLSAEHAFDVVVQANRRPEAVGSLEPLSLMEHGDAGTIDVSPYFSDPDGDALTYEATASHTDVVATDLSDSTLTITPLAEGQATVAVAARDPEGLSATQTVQVAVERSFFMRWMRGWRLKILSDHAEGSQAAEPQGKE